MDPSEFASGTGRQGQRRRHVDPVNALATVKRPDARPGCGDVARKRAARYARRHRIAKPFLPLLAAFILIDLFFERRAFSTLLRPERKTASEVVAGGCAAIPEPVDYQDIDRPPARREKGSTISGAPRSQYRLPADFLATTNEVVQIVSFLIRNRGKLDTDPVRMKWDILEQESLPLAIFLREIEAASAWEDLETEIADAPFDVPTAPGMGLPKAIRHQKILRLMPEWVQRGEDILSPEPAADNPAATPDIDMDDPDTKPPKP